MGIKFMSCKLQALQPVIDYAHIPLNGPF